MAPIIGVKLYKLERNGKCLMWRKTAANSIALWYHLVTAVRGLLRALFCHQSAGVIAVVS